MSKRKTTIYEFYAELNSFRPKIWRRFQVNSGITMAELGYILQVLFEMQAQHLMAFEVPEGKNMWRHMCADPEIAKMKPAFVEKFVNKDLARRFEIMDEFYEDLGAPNDNDRTEDMRFAKLQYVSPRIGDIVHFQYDFGDSWRITLKLDDIIKTDGVRQDEPPRVLDGIGFGIVEDCGGTSFLGGQKTLKFDIDDMNFRLQKIPRIYKESYERGIEPTQKSIDLIERKYLQKN